MRSADIVGGQLRLVLNNSLTAIEDGRIRIEQFLAGHALDAKARNRIEVVFEELVANTIRHGFTRNSGQSIHVSVTAGADGVELTFEDDGLAFNPLEMTLPARFTTLEEARIGGQGIPLVVKLSAAVRYEMLKPRGDAAGFAPQNRMVVRIAG